MNSSYNRGMKTLISTTIRCLSTLLLFPFLILGELQKTMSLLDDLKAAVAHLSGQVDTLLADDNADAEAVKAAEAARDAALAELATAQADLAAALAAEQAAKDAEAAAEAALAEAQANAVDADVVKSVTDISDKIEPPVVVEPTPEVPAEETPAE